MHGIFILPAKDGTNKDQKRELERFHLVLNNHKILDYLEPVKEELDALRQAKNIQRLVH